MLSVPTRRRARIALVTAVLGVVALPGCTGRPVPGHGSPAAEVDRLDAREACPWSEFECLTLAVPADHFAAHSPTWHVTFALHRGDVDSRGVLVTATGGPGSSGIALADSYLATLAPEITDHYDVVFFDQRGIGMSEPFSCERALTEGAGGVVDTSSAPAERQAFAGDARTFAERCLAEAGVHPEDADRYSTRQAVEDLELFRGWLGSDQLILYGESYGTEFHQAYAAAHPDRVAALVLDGVVDPGTDPLTFAGEVAQAYSDVLTATLVACDADPGCAADAPGSAVDGYDHLAAQLTAEPETFDYPLPDGTTEERQLTLEDLQSAAAWTGGAPGTRRDLQRALNAAAVGHYVPLARLAAAGWSADPDTGALIEDPTFSDALFYAVNCGDHAYVPDGRSPRQELKVWLDTAARTGVDRERLGMVFYGNMPCLFWPADPLGGVPPSSSVTDPPYPLLVLTADTDPNTPTQQAHRVLDRTVDDAAMVVQQGGPHVIYGRGNPCVDEPVTELITTGRLPAQRLTVCPGPVADPYVPNAPAEARGYTSAAATMDVLVGAVVLHPSYQAWPGDGELAVGCDAGGVARYELDQDDVVHVELDDCAWTPGVPVRGTVSVAEGGTGSTTASLVLPFAELDRSAAGAVTGTFRGRPVR